MSIGRPFGVIADAILCELFDSSSIRIDDADVAPVKLPPALSAGAASPYCLLKSLTGVFGFGEDDLSAGLG